jgi:hypothetical protein
LSFQTLIEWIHVSDLEDAELEQVRPLVRAALESLTDEEDPRREPLQQLEELCWEGAVPAEELRRLAADFEDFEEPNDEALLSEGERLELEFRRLAEEMPSEDWYTVNYKRVLQAVNQCKRGEPGPLERAVIDLGELFEKAWEPYSTTAIAPEEITAETVVGHRLLQEGIQGWFDALEQLELAMNGECEFDEALETAEMANRLCVAVQKLALRVRQEAAGRV